MDGYQQGGGGVRMGEKVQGIRSINGRYKIGKVKTSIGNGKAKELTCMTLGHELSGVGMLVGGGCRVEASKGEKRDNCNSIINKIYFLKRNK